VDPLGAALAYAGYVGGSGEDQGSGIALDPAGAAYITGLTASSETTFPVVGGPDPTFNGHNDALVARVSWTLSVDDVTMAEGTDGTTEFTFTLRLSAPSDGSVSVEFATIDGTAEAPGDYTYQSGTVTFLQGQVEEQVSVPVTADAVAETDETFTLQLLDANNAVVVDDTGLGTILDDDPPPTISIGDSTVTEGVPGPATAAHFTVTLSPASDETVTVQYSTTDGTAVAPADYLPVSLKTLVFEPGVVSQVIKIKIKADDLDEPDETFFVNLSSPTNASLGDFQGMGTILDNDP
jgi:hypothetical protein